MDNPISDNPKANGQAEKTAVTDAPTETSWPVLFFSLLLILSLLVPAGLLVWLRVGSDDHIESLDPTPILVWEETSTFAATRRQPATITLQWSIPLRIKAPSWSGMVTDVYLVRGSLLSSGSPVLQIDGVKRIAWETPSPFWRSLSFGTKGEDVLWLEQNLKAMGMFESEPDQSFNRATEGAVRNLASSIGAENSAVFDPSWIVWLPERAIEIDIIFIEPGMSAPYVGSPIVETSRTLAENEVKDFDGKLLSLPGEWVFTIPGIDQEFRLLDGKLSEEARNALGPLLDDGQASVDGVIQLAQAEESLVIPASSVVTSSEGDLCVYVSESGTPVRRSVSISAAPEPLVIVHEGLVLGEEVLANPTAFPETSECH